MKSRSTCWESTTSRGLIKQHIRDTTCSICCDIISNNLAHFVHIIRKRWKAGTIGSIAPIKLSSPSSSALGFLRRLATVISWNFCRDLFILPKHYSDGELSAHPYLGASNAG